MKKNYILKTVAALSFIFFVQALFTRGYGQTLKVGPSATLMEGGSAEFRASGTPPASWANNVDRFAWFVLDNNNCLPFCPFTDNLWNQYTKYGGKDVWITTTPVTAPAFNNKKIVYAARSQSSPYFYAANDNDNFIKVTPNTIPPVVGVCTQSANQRINLTVTIPANDAGEIPFQYVWQISSDGGTTWINQTNGAQLGGFVVSGADTNAIEIQNASNLTNGQLIRCLWKFRDSETNLETWAYSPAARVVKTAGTPNITGHPVNQTPITCTSGAPVTLTMNATNSDGSTPNFSWQRRKSQTSLWEDVIDGDFTGSEQEAVYSGAKTASLVISNPNYAANGYEYRGVVYGGCGNAQTTVATLRTLDKPTVDGWPSTSEIEICSTGSYRISVFVNSSNADIAWYQYDFAGNTRGAALVDPQTGMPAKTQSFALSTSVSGVILEAKNQCGTTSTQPIRIKSVSGQQNANDQITGTPLLPPSSYCGTGTTIINHGYVGNNITSEWRYYSDKDKSWVPFPEGSLYGATVTGGQTASLSITNATQAFFRSIRIYYRVSNACQTIAAALNIKFVSGTPEIIQQPTDVEICQNASTGTFTVGTDIKGESLSDTRFLWRYAAAGSNVFSDVISASGENWTVTTDPNNAYNRVLRNNSAAFAQNGRLYKLDVTNICGTTACDAAILQVSSAGPSITSGWPTNGELVICPGTVQSRDITVTTQGNALNHYRWQYSPDNQTWTNYQLPLDSPTKTFTNADVGRYVRIRIFNSCGTFSSSSVEIKSVTQSPSFTPTGQPLSKAVCTGSSVNFTAIALQNNTYQWQYSTNKTVWNDLQPGVFPGTATVFSDVNLGSMTISPATQFFNGYAFRVRISNGCPSGDIYSDVADLSVSNNAPVISQQPDNAYTCRRGVLGDPVLFQTVSPTPGVTYQWEQKQPSVTAVWRPVLSGTTSDGTVFSGATSHTLSISSVDIAYNDYEYRCVLDNGCSIKTAERSLKVNAAPPTITLTPEMTICRGASATFVGSAPNAIRYNFKVDNNNATPNPTNPTSLTFNENLYSYRVAPYDIVFEASNGCVASKATKLTYNEQITFVTQPVGDTLCSGQPYSLNVVVSGGGPYTYQWVKQDDTTKNETNVGSNSLTYVVSGGGTNSTIPGTYWVKVKNACSERISASAKVSVYTSVAITQQPPASLKICENGNATLSIVTDNRPSKYQWQIRNAAGMWVNVSGAGYTGTDTYKLEMMNVPMGYDQNVYRCEITTPGSCSTSQIIDSNETVLTVSSAIVFGKSLQPSYVVCAGGQQSFTETIASGGSSGTYKWERIDANNNATELSKGDQNGPSSSYASNNLTDADDAVSFRLSITNACGTYYKSTTVYVNSTPSVTGPATQQTVCIDQGFTLRATNIAGGGPYNFLWKKDGVEISGTKKTNQPNTINADEYTATAQSGDTGSYVFELQNACGTIPTNPTSISISNSCLTPVIPSNGQPKNAVVCRGGSASFTVRVTGANDFQWEYAIGSSQAAYAPVPATINGTSHATPSGSVPTDGVVTLNVSNIDTQGAVWFYRCKLTTTASSRFTYSASVSLNVNDSPTSFDAPLRASYSVCSGNSLKLNVKMKPGNGPYTYEWKRNAVIVKTTTTLLAEDALEDTNPSTANTYTVEVKNGCVGPVTSSTSAQIVSSVPRITRQPVNLSLCATSASYSGNLSLDIDNTQGVDYQWYENKGAWTPEIGQTSDKRTFSNPPVSINGQTWRCRITNGCGFIDSDPVAVYVSVGAPTMSKQPDNQTVCVGNAAALDIDAENTVSYQWQIKNTNTWTDVANVSGNIDGATSETLSFPNVSVSMNGNTYRCMIINGCQSVSSREATFSVNTASPKILKEPDNQSVCVGGDPVFSVVASGSMYAWEQRTSGGTWTAVDPDQVGLRQGVLTQNLTLNNVKIGLTGMLYHCKIDNGCATVYTRDVELSVNSTAPLLNQKPLDADLCIGGTLTLAVSVNGGQGPYTYTWKKDGTDVAIQKTENTLAVSDTFTKNNAQTIDAGQYSVEITNACQSTTNLPYTAKVTVNSPPTIAAQPDPSKSVCQGETLSLNINVNGGGNLIYTWYKDNNVIVGVNTSTYTKAVASASDEGVYYALIQSNCGGRLTSNQSIISVPTVGIVPPLPNSQVTLCNGQTFTTSFETSGTNLSYQWQKDGVDISSATASVFTKTNISQADEGLYTVTVNSPACQASVVSSAIRLSIGAGITEQPMSRQTICSQGTLTLKVKASNVSGYQWTFNGQDISGATADTYVKNAITNQDAGRYAVKLTTACGVFNSDEATVIVNDELTFYEQPANVTICQNGSASFKAYGTEGASYQWQRLDGQNWKDIPAGQAFDGTNYSGVNEPTMTLSAASPNNFKYRCVISNMCNGRAISTEATLTVNAGRLFFNRQPVTQTRCPNETIKLSVSAVTTGVSGGAITYQWIKDGASVGSNTNDYSVQATAETAGLYWVEISNQCGKLTSDKVQVNVGAGIVNNPVSRGVCPNNFARFTVTAAGYGPHTYQWYKDGNSILGATGAIYEIPSVKDTDEGNYTVSVGSSCGKVLSKEAKLSVGANVTLPPASASVCQNGSASFTVEATGANLQYGWQQKMANAATWTALSDGPLSGATITGSAQPTLNIANVSNTAMNNMEVRCVIASSCGVPKTSSTATLTLVSGNTAAFIRQPIPKRILCAGDEYTILADVANPSVSTFTWKKDLIDIGVNTPMLRIGQVTEKDAGSYTVEVSTCSGSAVSSQPTVLGVNQVNFITQMSPLATICDAGTIDIKARVSGQAPFIYTWQKGDNTLSETSENYKKTNVNSTDAGTYTLTVQSQNCLSAKAVAQTVVRIGTIIGQPALTKIVCPETSFNLMVIAAGNNLNYQWYKDGQALAGQTNPFIDIAKAQESDEGIYKVTVSGNGCASADSPESRVEVREKLAFITNLSDSKVEQCAGSPWKLSVNAVGAGTIAYQWKQNGADIIGQVYNAYDINSLALANSGDYQVFISDECQTSLASNTVKLTVTDGIKVNPPQDLTFCNGIIKLSVTPADPNNATFQWKKDNIDIPGATQATYINDKAKEEDSGIYTVSVSSPQCGAVISTPTNVEVGIAIKQQPVPFQGLCPGDDFTVSVEPFTSSTYAYAWEFNNSPIANAIQPLYTIGAPGVTLNDSGVYRVFLTNLCGTRISDEAILSVGTGIVEQPMDVATCEGLGFQFEVKIGGSNPILQWKKDGISIPGANDMIYAVENATRAHIGQYQATVSVCGVTLNTNNVGLSIGGDEYFRKANINVVAPQTSPISYGEKVDFKYTGPEENVTFQWMFGDGSISSRDASPSHNYYKIGIFNVNLRVSRVSAIACTRLINLAVPIEITGNVPTIFTGLLADEYALRVYPVPFKDECRIESKYPIEHITLTTLQGVPILQQEIPQQVAVSLRVNDVASGLYILTITDATGKTRHVQILKE